MSSRNLNVKRRHKRYHQCVLSKMWKNEYSTAISLILWLLKYHIYLSISIVRNVLNSFRNSKLYFILDLLLDISQSYNHWKICLGTKTKGNYYYKNSQKKKDLQAHQIKSCFRKCINYHRIFSSGKNATQNVFHCI